MKGRKRYRALFFDVGNNFYFNVKSKDSSHEVVISLRCTCRFCSLFPESKKLCVVQRCALRKLLKISEGEKGV